MPVIANRKKRQLGLVIPQRGLIKLKKGKTVLFACPGVKNYLKDSKTFYTK